jgi:ribonucleoside-diphosphate reductase alpha chain
MDIAQEILSQMIIHMKYSRYIDFYKRRETWSEIVDRNKNMLIKKFPFLEKEIEEHYKLVYEKKVLPSMRALQFSGKAIEVAPSRIFNCAGIAIDHWKVFSEIMFLLLGGSGVGISVQKHHIDKLPVIKKPSGRKRRYLIADSIEGWADAIKMLMKSYYNIKNTSNIEFDFSDIRPKGARLVTAGGKAPGAQPLKECILKIKNILEQKQDGEKLKPIECHDIICFISDAVLAGGIRRSSCISLFSYDDEEMLACKTGNWWELNPQRARANNSIILLRNETTKKQFDSIWEKIRYSNCGEPGIFFTNSLEMITNPCAEAALKASGGFCNLVEISSYDIKNQEEFNKRVKAAAFIGTLQASFTEIHYLRKVWLDNAEKEALLGIGITGIAANKLKNLDIKKSVNLAIQTNIETAKQIGINAANRITCIKPSGTTSLVVGSSSGIHAYHAKYYLRRVRVGKNEAIYSYFLNNFPELLEDCFFRSHDTAIISIPQKAPDGAILRDESPLELLERIKWFDENWIKPGHIKGDNTHSISATISIKDNEWEFVREWLWREKDHYNGISVLPYDNKVYKQMPFEEISKEKYEELFKSLREIDVTKIIEIEDRTDLKQQVACNGNQCELI